MPERSPAWYAIHTNAKCEPLVTVAINEMGMPALLPMCSWWVKHNHRQEQRMGPLFPRYLFSEFDLTDHWQRITREPGVVTILGMAENRGRPQAIAPAAIERIKQLVRVHQGAIPLDDEKKKIPLAKGDRVAVIDGPLAGYRGLVSVDKKERLSVMLDMMHLKKPIPIPRDALVRE